eukprot:7230899-Heterocapsa_arctica.AAC.1
MAVTGGWVSRSMLLRIAPDMFLACSAGSCVLVFIGIVEVVGVVLGNTVVGGREGVGVVGGGRSERANLRARYSRSFRLRPRA